jgi:hypothetical protein
MTIHWFILSSCNQHCLWSARLPSLALTVEHQQQPQLLEEKINKYIKQEGERILSKKKVKAIVCAFFSVL